MSRGGPDVKAIFSGALEPSPGSGRDTCLAETCGSKTACGHAAPAGLAGRVGSGASTAEAAAAPMAGLYRAIAIG